MRIPKNSYFIFREVQERRGNTEDYRIVALAEGDRLIPLFSNAGLGNFNEVKNGIKTR